MSLSLTTTATCTPVVNGRIAHSVQRSSQLRCNAVQAGRDALRSKLQLGKGRTASSSVGITRASQEAAATEAKEETFPKLKGFLKDLQEVGRVRIIVNTGMAVLESVTTLEGIFFMQYGDKGEYGNIMKDADNVDFHMLLPDVAKVQLVTTNSKAGDFKIHSARFYNKEEFNAATIFVMWKPGTKGDYDPGQVEAFQKLLEKYGEEISFS